MHSLTKSLALVFYVCAAIFLMSPLFMAGPGASADTQSSAPQGPPPTAQCPDAKESSLPLPSSLPPDEFHDKLLAFLQNIEYVKLNWCVDKGVRDTGPFVSSNYLGVHPAVRIYYSPAIMNWLVNGRINSIPDGAMIVKEMYNPGPAARYDGQPLKPA